MEHHSNIVPWYFHRERKGAVLRWVDIGDDGSFSMEAFEKALNERTRIVAITQMSNVLGTAPPIKEVIRLAYPSAASPSWWTVRKAPSISTSMSEISVQTSTCSPATKSTVPQASGFFMGDAKYLNLCHHLWGTGR